MLNKLNNKKMIIYFIILISLLYVFNIWQYDLWAPDEPRYAEVAREMLAEDNWIIPHLNNRIYYEKPPLFFAMIALFGKFLGGLDVGTVRLPVIFLSLAILAYLFKYLRKKFNWYFALLTGLILATTGQYFWLSMRVNLDIPLVFSTTIAALLLFELIDGNKKQFKKSFIAFLLMGLAVLFKSPISLLPVAVIIIYALIEKKATSLKNINWLSGMLIFFLPAVIWVVLATNEAGYSYFKITVIDQLIGYSTGSQGHPNPIYYYLINFPLQALPWSIFLPSSFYYLYKFRKELPPLIRYSLVWFISIFIIFSLVGSKRGVYLLQIYPPFAIIIAWFFQQHFNKKIKEKYSLVIPTFIFAIILLLVGGLFYLQGPDLIKEELQFSLADRPQFRSLYQLIYLFLFLSGTVFAVTFFFKKKRNIFNVVFVFAVILILLLKGILFPVVNQVKSERFLAKDMAAIYQKEDTVVLWGSLNNDSGFVFYNGIYFDKIINDPQSIRKFLTEQKPVILIANDAAKFYEHFSKNEIKEFYLKKYRVGSDDMLLIRKEANEILAGGK